MNKIMLITCFLLTTSTAKSQLAPHHYIFFNLDRERIRDTSFLNINQIQGAQLKYTWKELEPEKDHYDLDLVQNDLDFLKANGKALFIQIQDVSFDTIWVPIPSYLRKDPIYHDGANYQYHFLNDDETKYEKEGLVARRWDLQVAERFHLLLKELEKRFDGKITGINLPETAVEFGNKKDLHPPGFTFEVYKNAIKENMRIAKKAFPNTVIIQYANFMPGEWLPSEDHSYMRDLFQYAKQIHVGMEGPDILVYKKGQMSNSYQFVKQCAGIIPTGLAVQDGNYAHINPQTGKEVTFPEIYIFGKEYLKLNYIFWCTEEPYYSTRLLSFLRGLKE